MQLSVSFRNYNITHYIHIIYMYSPPAPKTCHLCASFNLGKGLFDLCLLCKRFFNTKEHFMYQLFTQIFNS